MALVRTAVVSSDTAADTTEGSGHDSTVNCGTVTDGDLLIIGCGGTSGDSAAGAPPNLWTVPNKSSGTGTVATAVEIAEASIAPATNDYIAAVQAWRMEVTGTGTLVLNYGDEATSFGCGIIVYKYTGWDTSTPILSGPVTDVADGSGNFSPTTATLGTAPASGDETLQFTTWDAFDQTGKGDITAGSGFTMRNQLGDDTNYVDLGCSTRTGSTSTTLTWNTTDNTPSTFSKAGVGFTVQAAVSLRPAPVRNIRPRGNSINLNYY